MRRGRVIAQSLALGVLLLAAGPARAEMSEAQRDETLRAALAAFDRATEMARQQPAAAAEAYRESARGFEALIADGVRNGRLHYNLGNAYLQLGELGKAVASYRRAEALIGNDPSLQANLRFARSLCRSQIPARGGEAALRTALFWHYETPLAARFWVAVVGYAAFWGVLLMRSLTRAPGWGFAAAALLVVWLAAGTSTTIEWTQRERSPAGVTIADDIVVRKGNGEAYEPQFNEPLHAGVEFRVIDQRPGWLKIELADGSTGWLKQSQVEII